MNNIWFIVWFDINIFLNIYVLMRVFVCVPRRWGLVSRVSLHLYQNQVSTYSNFFLGKGFYSSTFANWYSIECLPKWSCMSLISTVLAQRCLAKRQAALTVVSTKSSANCKSISSTSSSNCSVGSTSLTNSCNLVLVMNYKKEFWRL